MKLRRLSLFVVTLLGLSQSGGSAQSEGLSARAIGASVGNALMVVVSNNSSETHRLTGKWQVDARVAESWQEAGNTFGWLASHYSESMGTGQGVGPGNFVQYATFVTLAPGQQRVFLFDIRGVNSEEVRFTDSTKGLSFVARLSGLIDSPQPVSDGASCPRAMRGRLSRLKPGVGWTPAAVMPCRRLGRGIFRLQKGSGYSYFVV